MRHDRTKPKTEVERFKLSVAFGQTIRSPLSKTPSANDSARPEAQSKDSLVPDKGVLPSKRTPRLHGAPKLDPITRSPAHRSPYKSLRLPSSQAGESKATSTVLSSAGKHKARVAS